MEGLIEYLSRHYQKVAEIGIGSYFRVALALKDRGLEVLATDVQPRDAEFPVVFDDITSPHLDLYHGVQAIYAIRPPLELVDPLKNLARRLLADLIIKPLASEPVDGSLINFAGTFFYLYSKSDTN